MIRLTSFLWVWFQCVCPLMPSCNTYRVFGFLLPWAWGISSRLLQQSAAAAPYLGWGVSPHCGPSWPSAWDSSSRPSCARAATTPWTWSCSSWPPPLAYFPLTPKKTPKVFFSLLFWSWVMMYLGMDLFSFILFVVCSAYWVYRLMSFVKFGTFLVIISSNTFSAPQSF